MCGLVSLTLLAFAAFPALAQEQLWVTQFGTRSPDRAHALAPDGARGVIVAGHTRGSLGGPVAGLRDVFLARFDGEGNQLWIRQFGAFGLWHSAFALAPDGAGGAIVAGHVNTMLVGVNVSGDDAFVARYDGAGNQLWLRQFGTSSTDWARAAAPDGAGGVMIGGRTKGNLGGPNAGGTDAFLARYDGAGDQLWIRQFGTSTVDSVRALAPDGAGGVMVMGFTEGSLGGPNPIPGNSDVFLARYDREGNQLWIRQFGTGEDESGWALASDGAGGVMIAGGTWGSLGGLSAGSADAFLARYDSEGNQLWIRQFGTSTSEHASALAADGAGGVIVAGDTWGRLGGPHAGGVDVFLARYDADGNRLWFRQFGTSEREEAKALAPDGAGAVMVAGWTGGDLGGPLTGGNDAFLARFEIDSCYADCDQSGALDIFDFLCFQNSFVAGEAYACECDPDPACDVFDFLCFQNAFVAGCP